MHEPFEHSSLLGSDDWLAWERQLKRFEQAWRQGPPPAIADFLPADDVARDAVLRELVHTDLEFRLRAGEAARVESYLSAYPELAADRTFVLDLLTAEYRRRRTAGLGVTEAEYHARFPEYATELFSGLSGPASSTLRGGRRAAAVRTDWPLVPGYEILSELGRGGMGVVYKARHLKLNRLAALKVIRESEKAGEEERARFRTEIEAAARLQHPNVVQVFEVGEWQGPDGRPEPYVALEYVDGGTLAARLAGAPQPAHETAALVETLARALHHAHEHGVVHRDLKPANILLQEDLTQRRNDAKPEPDKQGQDGGQPSSALLSSLAPWRLCVRSSFVPKITDFGLAKQLDADTGQTRTGQIVGTPRYMAPEQVHSQPGTVSPAVDVYALGVILYECLTGRPPFAGATALDTLEQVRSLDPVSPRSLQPRTPRDLETICLRCLQKEPQRRYGSALALAEDLRRFQAGEPIRARPVSEFERLVKWARRRPGTAGLIVTVVVAVLTGLGMTTWQMLRADAAQRAEAQEKNLKDAALQKARRSLYFSQVALADREWWANRGDRADALLDDCEAELRGWEWHYLKRRCRTGMVRCRGHDNGVSRVAFSPDGKRLVSGSIDGTVRLWEAATGQELDGLHATGSPVWALAWSPDGTYVAFGGGDGNVRLWAPLTNQEVKTLTEYTPNGANVVFGRDGKWLATADRQGGVRLVEMPTGKTLGSFGMAAEAKQWVTALALSPDGEELAVFRREGKLEFWKAAAEATLLRTLTIPYSVTQMTYQSDGSTLALVDQINNLVVIVMRPAYRVQAVWRKGKSRSFRLAYCPGGQILAQATDGTVSIWDAMTGKERFSFPAHVDILDDLAFSPDGRQLAVSGENGAVKIWDWQKAAPVGQTFDFPAGVLHPNGQWLFFAKGDSIVRVEAATGRETDRWRGHTGSIRALAVAPDGKRFASGGQDSTVQVWDLAAREAVLRLEGHTEMVWNVTFSPDGLRLASASGDRTARIWDARTGALLHTLAGHAEQVTAVAFHPDGTRLATASKDHSVKLWDAATGQELQTLSAHTSGVHTVAFSPNGQLLASAGHDKNIHLWDLATGEVVRTCSGHTGRVHVVTFTPDGKRLASSGQDAAVRLWDVETATELVAMPGTSFNRSFLSFSADGRKLAGVAANGLQIWDATPLDPPPSP